MSRRSVGSGGVCVADGPHDLGLAVANAREVLVDGSGGAAAGGHRLDDRLGAGDDVAAGEDPGAAGGERPRVGHDAGPAADLDPGALGEDRRIGLLADGDEDRRGRQLARRTGRAPRRRPPRSASPVGRMLVAADRDDGAIAPDDLGRRQALGDHDALALGGLDLLLLRRHVRAAAAVDDRDRRRRRCAARSGPRPSPCCRRPRRSRRPDRLRVLAEVDLLEEPGRRDDARAGRRRARPGGGSWRRRSRGRSP